jgi:hypothetical protein
MFRILLEMLRGSGSGHEMSAVGSTNGKPGGRGVVSKFTNLLIFPYKNNYILHITTR